MQEDTDAIIVNDVSKEFRLPSEKIDSLKSTFVTLFSSKKKNNEVLKALDNINFSIKKGEFFGVVGRNGSGKSTLLKVLANIYQPSHGTVFTNGKLVPFIELGVGFNPELTGKENVYLNGAMFGFSVKEVRKMYEDIVEFAELGKFMDQKLKNYSSGMQVRLAFSMATRSKADILLVDEVLAVGDADFQRKCYEYFNQLKKTKKTVVFVSHDMDAVQRYCDRAMLIESSKIKKIGNTIDVAEAYQKLFVKKNKNENKNDEETKRWGDNSISIKSVKIDVKEEVVVSVNCLTKQSVEKPTTGIRIRSSTGQAIAGTNSEIEHVNIKDLKNGEHFTLTWKFPNVFSDGNYIVDIVMAYNNGTIVADWWDEASSFGVKKARQIPYHIDLDYQLNFEQL